MNQYQPNYYPQQPYPQQQPYDQPLKVDATIQLVYPMCCCCYSITEKFFYSFINFFDLVFAVVLLVFKGTTINEDKVTNSCYLTLYGIWFVLAVVSYVMYCSSASNYGTFIHKLYAIIRMGLAIVNLVFICMGVVIAIIALNHDNVDQQTHGAIVAAILVTVLVNLPLGIVSVNWSCILSRVVHNRGLMNN